MIVGFGASVAASFCISTTPPCAGETCEASFDLNLEEMRSTGSGGGGALAATFAYVTGC